MIPTLVLSSALFTAAAVQQPDSLPRVVITATRVDGPTGAAIAASTVIDRLAIERSGATDVAEVLRRVAGVSMARSGGPGAQSSLFLRGGENDYVRVLVDGVHVNDPGGALDLAWLSLADVERIEVVRGPASVLYGTDAVSGVVQIFTRRATAPTADAEVAAGRYGTSLLRSVVATGSHRFMVTAGGSRERSDGILAFNSGYARDVLSAALRVTPGPHSRVDLAARTVNDEYHYPTNDVGAAEDRNALRDNRRLIGSLNVSHAWARVRGELSLASLDLRGADDDRQDSPGDTVGLFSYDARSTVRRRVADARVHLRVAPTSVLTVGAEAVREAQRGNDSSNYSVERSRFAADRRNEAVYVQWLNDIGPVSFTAGARYDENDTFGAFRTGRAGVAVRAWAGGTLRGTVSTAFKGPTFFESFNTAFSIGNADLVPERSLSWEAGVRQVSRTGRLSFEATWFDQRFRDMIQYAFVSPDEPNFFNVASASARGLELEATGALSNRIRAGLSGTLVRTRVDDAGLMSGEGAVFVEGNRLLRRPPIVLVGSLGVDLPGRATFDLAARYTGTRDDRDFATFPATSVVLPGYTRLDVAFTGPVVAAWTGAALDLVLRVENVSGAGYEEIVHYRAPGRSLTIGLRASSRGR